MISVVFFSRMFLKVQGILKDETTRAIETEDRGGNVWIFKDVEDESLFSEEDFCQYRLHQLTFELQMKEKPDEFHC